MTQVTAEMTANVWKLTVSEGEVVSAGQTIAMLESMKMEIPVEATVDGTVHFVVQEGDDVAEGTVLAVIS